MGMTPLYFCFKDYKPNSLICTAFILNSIIMAISLKGEETIFASRNGTDLIVIFDLLSHGISFVLLICLFIINNCLKGEEYVKKAKDMCKCLVVLCLINIFFFLIEENRIIANKESSKWLIYGFLRFLVLILSIIIGLCANVLYEKINKNPSDNNTISTNQVNISISQSNEGPHPQNSLNSPSVFEGWSTFNNLK